MPANWKEAAKARLRERRTPETLVAIPVQEWGTTIHYWPEMTLAERNDITQYVRQEGDSTVMNLEAIAMTLIVRARDAEGKRLFSRAERQELMTEYEAEVLARIVAQMTSVEISSESAEKN